MTAATVEAIAPACAARAQYARDLAARHGINGQGFVTRDVLAWRLAWDAPAAGEYPRAMLADAVDCERVAPEYAAAVWHHVAGACIVGTLCACPHPAFHRDALADIARAIRSEVTA